jgi:hypothetical protein
MVEFLLDKTANKETFGDRASYRKKGRQETDDVMSKRIWQMLGEEFDNNIPRLTAIYVKEEDGTQAFAYPTGESRLGYFFDFSIKTGYELIPKFKFDFAVYEYPSIMRVLGPNRALFKKQTYYPSLIKREFEYTNLALMGTERLGRIHDKSLTWSFDMTCRTEGKDFDKNLFSVLSSDEVFSVEKKENGLIVSFSDMNYCLAFSEGFDFGLYDNEVLMKEDLKRNQVSQGKSGRYLVIMQHLFMKPLERKEWVIGLSATDMKHARKALSTKNFEKKIAKVWNDWFNSLPVVSLNDKKEAKVYYKCWTVIKNNYYDHPQWGHSITEALPVYKGIWQWAIPSVEWHSDQNTEYTSLWIKKAMDMMVDSQREDGYITHAIYIDEEIPGERWGKGGVIQTPHFPWTAVRYYHATGDIESLRRWFKPLIKYYEYINRSRDEAFRSLHLWAITTSFDTGLDTTPVFQRVTYGEEGIPKEKYCYPAIFGAERYRYESALGEMAKILGEDPAFYLEEAEKTKKAMNRYLWDEEKKWYGVIREDGRLDTRVGVDGLFAFVYGTADQEKIDAMRKNFERLIGLYGIRTVAEGEEGFREDVYWRGPCWPKTCSLGMYICKKYYPDLVPKAYDAIIRMCLLYPSIWECYNVRTGELARSDHGFVCTPGVSSNVGAGDIIGALYEYHGLFMYDMDMTLPLTPLERFHHKGLRITVEQKDDQWVITVEKEETDSAEVAFRSAKGVQKVRLTAGEKTVL